MLSNLFGLTQTGGIIDPKELKAPISTTAIKNIAGESIKFEITASGAYIFTTILAILLLSIVLIMFFSTLRQKLATDNSLYYLLMAFIVTTVWVLGFIRVGYDTTVKRYVLAFLLVCQLAFGASLAGLSYPVLEGSKRDALIAFIVLFLLFEGIFIGFETWNGKVVATPIPGA